MKKFEFSLFWILLPWGCISVSEQCNNKIILKAAAWFTDNERQTPKVVFSKLDQDGGRQSRIRLILDWGSKIIPFQKAGLSQPQLPLPWSLHYRIEVILDWCFGRILLSESNLLCQWCQAIWCCGSASCLGGPWSRFYVCSCTRVHLFHLLSFKIKSEQQSIYFFALVSFEQTVRMIEQTVRMTTYNFLHALLSTVHI